MDKNEAFQLRMTRIEKEAAMARADRDGVRLSDVVRKLLAEWVRRK